MTQDINRRKNYFIKKKFQGKFIIRFCILVILGAVITGILLYIFSNDTVTTAFVNSRLSIVRTSDYILPVLISSSLISLVLVSIATALIIMYLSHRIAGPLYKIEESIKEIGEGNLNLKIKLRSTDEIREMADSINGMTHNIKDHITQIKNGAAELTRQIDDLNRILKDNSSLSMEARSALQDLLAKKEQLNKTTDYFKIDEAV